MELGDIRKLKSHFKKYLFLGRATEEEKSKSYALVIVFCFKIRAKVKSSIIYINTYLRFHINLKPTIIQPRFLFL